MSSAFRCSNFQKYGFVFSFILGLSHTAAAGSLLKSATQSIDLSGTWLFHNDDNMAFARPRLDDYGWTQLQLPTHNLPKILRFAGYGWFRYHLQVAPQAANEEYLLEMGPARHAVELYVNGIRIGGRGQFGSQVRGADAITPLLANIPQGLLKAGDNVIAARVYDPSYQSGFPIGPLRIGPPQILHYESKLLNGLPRSLRLTMAGLSLFVALTLLIGNIGRYAGRDFWWLFGAAISFAPWFLQDTGILSALLPNLDLALRIPFVSAALALFFLGSYFLHRFGSAQIFFVRAAQTFILAWTALLLLLPAEWVYLGATSVLWVFALMASLYIANLLLMSVRRREPLAWPVFLIVLLVFVSLLYDSLVQSKFSVYPTLSQWASFGAMLATVISNIRFSSAEHERVLLSMLESRQRLAEGASLAPLDAAALALGHLPEFLEKAVHQVSNDLSVRRCSLILADDRGELKIRAAVGLPRHAVLSKIDIQTSIAGWAFSQGERVTTEHLPPGLQRSGQGQYVTDAFVAQPIFAKQRVVGVLNVSDRNNGGGFSSEDEEQFLELSQKIGAVLSRFEDLIAPWRETDESARAVTVLESSAVVQEPQDKKSASLIIQPEP